MASSRSILIPLPTTPLATRFIGRVRQASPRIAHRRVVHDLSGVLGFANNRLTIADFRDVGFLGV
jgi:hypothetical protein